MDIYLPIAEMSVNAFSLIILGIFNGLLSGLFGIGGGFLTTPLLIFFGISPAVAVASSANQIVASSLSGFLAHWRKGNVDVRMGMMMLFGGVFGSTLGVWLFQYLKGAGQIDLVVTLLYIIILTGIGILMLLEGRSSTGPSSTSPGFAARVKEALRFDQLPLKSSFPQSNLEISLLLPMGISFAISILVSFLGIGGGFLLIPAMIYLLGMPTTVVIGTSLFQMIFITANVTILQAVTTQTVDIVLAVLLIIGSVIGSHFGTRYGSKLPAASLRKGLAILVMLVAAKLLYGLFITPEQIYTIHASPL